MAVRFKDRIADRWIVLPLHVPQQIALLEVILMADLAFVGSLLQVNASNVAVDLSLRWEAHAAYLADTIPLLLMNRVNMRIQMLPQRECSVAYVADVVLHGSMHNFYVPINFVFSRERRTANVALRSRRCLCVVCCTASRGYLTTYIQNPFQRTVSTIEGLGGGVKYYSCNRKPFLTCGSAGTVWSRSSNPVSSETSLVSSVMNSPGPMTRFPNGTNTGLFIPPTWEAPKVANGFPRD
mmetsp:Transcript_40031/g.159241  ORF Transcript_40031/g.159241 Transcript_40031/m.159241 type:complete len:238 (-) Transcript_40031:1008-1721(-)